MSQWCIERWEDEGGALQALCADAPREHCMDSSLPGHQANPSVGAEVDHQKTTLQQEGGLPAETADWLTEPFARFFRMEAAAAVVLLVATTVALVMSNSVAAATFMAFWETPLGLSFGESELSRSLIHWINDGLMTLFFFVIALELKREIVFGDLRVLRVAAFSLAGAIGGILVPAGLFLVLMHGEAGAQGWGTVTATDTAFAVGALALLGSRIPPALRLFVLSLAIFDDAGAILIVALGYGQGLNWSALMWVAIGLLVLSSIARLGVRNIPVYCAIGALTWYACDASGLHPTLIGVAIGLMTPTSRWVSNSRLRAILSRVLSHPMGATSEGDAMQRQDLERATTAAKEARSPLERLELMLHPWVGFAVLPLFALANAHVTFSQVNVTHPVVIATVVAMVIGKPLGVFAVSWMAVRFGLAVQPKGIRWSVLAAAGLLTGIGFTMSLFVSRLAYPSAMMIHARFGIILASAISATTGVALLFILTSGRFRTPPVRGETCPSRRGDS